MRGRKRVHVRPGKAAGVLGLVMGLIFAALGVFVVIPIFGPFGIVWTLMALAISVYNGVMAFGKTYVGPEINIETDAPVPDGENAKDRLLKLEELYREGLISREEYESKRSTVIDEL